MPSPDCVGNGLKEDLIKLRAESRVSSISCRSEFFSSDNEVSWPFAMIELASNSAQSSFECLH